MDHIDRKIIDLLKDNSRLTNKEIGQEIHMTGQAVGLRINKLIDDRVIKKYTIDVDDVKLGNHISAVIKIIMISHDHRKIKSLIQEEEGIVNAYKVSSDGCYSLKVSVKDNQALDDLLEKINVFANYQLAMIVTQLK